jgi:hypothetical protein
LGLGIGNPWRIVFWVCGWTSAWRGLMAGIFGILESSATQWYQDVAPTQDFFFHRHIYCPWVFTLFISFLYVFYTYFCHFFWSGVSELVRPESITSSSPILSKPCGESLFKYYSCPQSREKVFSCFLQNRNILACLKTVKDSWNKSMNNQV